MQGSGFLYLLAYKKSMLHGRFFGLPCLPPASRRLPCLTYGGHQDLHPAALAGFLVDVVAQNRLGLGIQPGSRSLMGWDPNDLDVDPVHLTSVTMLGC